jgi:hypothetical protein
VTVAYVSDVEKQEEQFLSKTDAKAQHDVAEHAKQAAGPSDAQEVAGDMFQAGEGRWGSGGVEISDVALLDDKGEPAHDVSYRRCDDTSAEGQSRQTGTGLRLRRGSVQRPRASASTARTRASRSSKPTR